MLSVLLASAVASAEVMADPSLDANYWARFLMQVLIILIFVRIMGKLLGYIHQPPVIGEILAGIIVGPSVLGQSTVWSEKIFPPSSWNYFTLVGNIGLILFMFNLGLELDEKLLKKQWKFSFPIACSAILVPYGLGAAISSYLYDINSRDGFQDPDYPAFVLFTGAALSFTAFPVLASLLTSTGLLSTPIGISALSCAAIDDVLAWTSLAVASSFAKGSGIVGLYVFLVAIGWVLFMILLVRPALAKYHEHLMEKDDEMNKTFLVVIIFNLLLAGLFCELLGIHSFFGAFVAGLISPKKGKFAHFLFPKIELITNELLLPLFFASSGMKTNIGSIDSGFYVGLVVLLYFVATLAKFLPACFVAKLVTKRDWRFCIGLGFLMNTRGLVQLIALSIGLSLKILSPRLFTIHVIVALLTTFTTAPALWFVYQKKSKPLERGLNVDASLAHDNTHNRLETVRNADELAIEQQLEADQPIEMPKFHLSSPRGGSPFIEGEGRSSVLMTTGGGARGRAVVTAANDKFAPVEAENHSHLTSNGSDYGNILSTGSSTLRTVKVHFSDTEA
jgi:Kef-type K+ transport system membrane component KefB